MVWRYCKLCDLHWDRKVCGSCGGVTLDEGEMVDEVMSGLGTCDDLSRFS